MTSEPGANREQDTNELLPCPFCGIDEPSIAEFGGGFYIECRDCPASMEDDHKALVIAAWNTRV